MHLRYYFHSAWAMPLIFGASVLQQLAQRTRVVINRVRLAPSYRHRRAMLLSEAADIIVEKEGVTRVEAKRRALQRAKN